MGSLEVDVQNLVEILKKLTAEAERLGNMETADACLAARLILENSLSERKVIDGRKVS